MLIGLFLVHFLFKFVRKRNYVSYSADSAALTALPAAWIQLRKQNRDGFYHGSYLPL